MIKTLASILVFLCVILFSCKNESKSSDISTTAIGDTLPIVADGEGTWRFDSLSVDKQIHINDDPKKKAMSISVYLSYPVSAPNGVKLDAVQKTIAQLFDSEHKPATIKNAFDNIVTSYIDDAHNYGKEWEDENNEFIDFSNYEQHTGTSIEYVSAYMITISTAQSSYLGGAHGSYYIKYYNISTQDGNLVTEEDLFKKGYKPQLAQLIQNEVERRNQSANEDQQISLLVEINEIAPNANFYFDKNYIVYVFNQYEIAPYVQGVIEIRIPIKKVKPLINDKYLLMFDAVPEKV